MQFVIIFVALDGDDDIVLTFTYSLREMKEMQTLILIFFLT